MRPFVHPHGYAPWFVSAGRMGAYPDPERPELYGVPPWLLAADRRWVRRDRAGTPPNFFGPAVVGGVPAGVAAGSTGLGDLVLVLVQLGKFKSVD